MSTNYTCNQFDAAYRPTRLGNWEVPKWHLNRPKGRTAVTKVIANDRGHLLPGVQKTDQKHWAGLYLGTYQLPKRITKEIAMELSNPKCQTWMKRSYHHPFIARDQKDENDNDKPENEQNVCRDEWKTKPDERTNEETANNRESIESVKSAMSLAPTAADVSAFETLRKCASADGVGARSVERGEERRASSAAHTPSSPALSRISVAGNRLQPEAGTAATAERPADRRYREDAHRHQGLPDTIEDAVYRSLQTKRYKHPGLGLEGCWPECSAVAYKSFNDPGPTQCSKLRVYRPKTSSSAAGDAAGARKELSTGRRRGTGGEPHSPRPKTSVPVITAQQLTDIKLALCWDLDAPFDRNARSSDRPAAFHEVHGGADGNGKLPPAAPPQNGSSAVMGFVQAAPAERRDVVPEARRTQTRECLPKNRNLSAVMELIPNKDRGGRGPSAETERSGVVAAADRTALSDKLPPPPPPPPPSSSSSCRSKSGSAAADGAKTRGKPAAADDRNGGFDDVRSRRRRRRRRSLDDAAENEPKNHRQPPRQALRPCLACDDPAAAAAANCGRKEPRECGHYKMAFKAGVPVSTPVRNRAGRHQQLKVPKPRTTNSDKKKYVIGTLLPPFSMWPGTTARDYPEHWRLTSVYRQAFKPLELRKQPFLQTIYL